MEKMDPARESRVWQRVSAQPGQKPDDLRPLMLSAREAIGDYRYLSAQMKGGEGAKKLLEGAQETLACLRGMQLLRGGPLGKNGFLPPSQGTVRRVLEISYHRARRMAAEYTARSADSECGIVFLHLAKREEEACVKIAGLMGQMGK